MSRVIGNFEPQRLESALAARGFTGVELAARLGVTPTTISRWRKSTQLPSGELLNRLASELRVTPQWLTRPPCQALSAPYFRGSIAQMKSDRELLRSRISWLAESAEQLATYVDFPEVNVPRLPFAKPREISEQSIEAAAQACRSLWGLKDGPIADVVLVLENAGVIVSREETGTARIEGLSAWSSSGRPYVLLCADKANGFRSRFDAAHELGHLVLHGSIAAATDAVTHKLMEHQAHRFAGAFLMPAKSFSGEISLPVSLQGLLLLKRRWGVSVAAMIMRLVALGIVGDSDYLRLIKLRSAKWGNKQEPLDEDLDPEVPRVLRRTVALLVQCGVLTEPTLPEFLGLSMGDIESLLGFPWGSLTRPSAEVIALPWRGALDGAGPFVQRAEAQTLPRIGRRGAANLRLVHAEGAEHEQEEGYPRRKI